MPCKMIPVAVAQDFANENHALLVLRCFIEGLVLNLL